MTHRTTHHRPGFTLLEILVVVSILAVLAMVSAPYIAGIAASARLRTAADTVHNRLLEAQSLAILFNTDVELRLYEVADLIDGRTTLRRLRILTLRPPEDDPAAAAAANTTTDVFEPVGAVTSLDQEIEISTDVKLSSIINLGFTPSTSDRYGQYIALRFHADGSPALLPAKPWFLTLHEKDAHLNEKKLKNFVTLQIDAATGRLRTFQP